MLILRRFALVLMVMSSACCCSTLMAQTASSPEFSPSHQEYFVRGTVVSVHSRKSAITIRGNSLAGYLRFRQKSYQVRHPEVLRNFRPGDQVKAVYSARDRKIYHLVHTAVAPLAGTRVAAVTRLD